MYRTKAGSILRQSRCFNLLLALISPISSSARAESGVQIADVVEKVLPGVVNLRTRDKQKTGALHSAEATATDRSSIDAFLRLFMNPGSLFHPKIGRSLGSGFLYREAGIVVTNYHVVADAETVDVLFGADELPRTARLVGHDARADIAVLRVRAPGKARALGFGRSERSRIGESVFAIGNPHGFGHSVTSGILSGKGRSLGAGQDEFLQTDAAVNPGNSGGPLFNLRGEVIGINVATLADAKGISFAIPSEVARPLVDAIIDRSGSGRPWLGLVVTGLDEPKATMGREVLTTTASPAGFGVYVSNLAKGSPAEKAGLRAGDVVLQVNGERVSSPQHLQKLARKAGVGGRLAFKVRRAGGTVPFTVVLAPFPEDVALEATENLY